MWCWRAWTWSTCFLLDVFWTMNWILSFGAKQTNIMRSTLLLTLFVTFRLTTVGCSSCFSCFGGRKTTKIHPFSGSDHNSSANGQQTPFYCFYRHHLFTFPFSAFSPLFAQMSQYVVAVPVSEAAVLVEAAKWCRVRNPISVHYLTINRRWRSSLRISG